ncbi:MAG: pilus assembly protein PilP [Oceanospirillales bacterium]|uniref:Type IV pilus assembly protein PilP n=1 Tax=Marinobacterium halophilum TaxID=267374 RepID=A0A2P8EX99_9GAMM|nr:pilus assembly protein PilP [Marinobacterium halophilum]MBR9827777.1 pilus assembly protein PilP [Oceanospirillales bacterium]PSL14088.1 type IV pilus assembly protein PilP [Marinobacterium halophilum]
MMIRNKIRQGVRLGLALSVILPLTGCIWVDDTQDLQRYTREQQARPSGRIEPLPTFKPYESFVYEGSSLRDPFRPLVRNAPGRDDIAGDDAIKPNQDRPKEYLEEFSVDQLNMVGIITEPGGSTLWALIEDPNQEVHRVVAGNYLGNDHGEVTTINERGLELVEIISNGRGGWMKRPRSLTLEQQD